jgi:hypothetical protein
VGKGSKTEMLVNKRSRRRNKFFKTLFPQENIAGVLLIQGGNLTQYNWFREADGRVIQTESPTPPSALKSPRPAI